MEIASISYELLAILFMAAVLAGLVDTLAGGGGLIVVPALILSGVPPLAALGTNKLQGCMGTATSSYMMLKTKRVVWSDIQPAFSTAFIGSIVGTIAVQFLEAEVLSFVIPVVLLIIAVYFLISPTPETSMKKVRISSSRFKNRVAPAIGFYDGMFGPGTGSFFAFSGVFFRGYGLVESTAKAKPLNFATNLASLIIFIAVGQIVWVIGLLMMMGQVIGAWLGSHFLIKINPNLLRAFVVLVCFSMLVRYVFSQGWF